MVRFSMALALTCLALPAFGKGPLGTGPLGTSRIALASIVVQRTGSGLLNGASGVASELVTPAAAAPQGLGLTPASEALVEELSTSVSVGPAIAPNTSMERRAAKAKSRVDYKAFFGRFGITRDLQIPGAPTLAVRLLPASLTQHASTGSPIVVTPRLVGSDWYGLDVAAHF